jgi:hypothetical protein
MSSECSAAGVPVGGNGNVCPCAGLWILTALVAVGLLPPAFSLWPHAPPGKKRGGMPGPVQPEWPTSAQG